MVSGMVLNIVSVNVWSIVSELRCKSVFEYLKDVSADVFFLQEYGIGYGKDYGGMEELWVHGESVWSGMNENRNAGVAILFKNRKCIIKETTVIQDGRALMVNVVCNGKELKLVNVYAPTEKNERYDLFESFSLVLSSAVPVVLGGDWNCIRSIRDRKSESKEFKLDTTCGLLNRIIKDFKLLDCYRIHHQGECFTWSNTSGSRKSRIDMFLISEGLKCKDCFIEPVFFFGSCTVECCAGDGRNNGFWEGSVEIKRGITKR